MSVGYHISKFMKLETTFYVYSAIQTKDLTVYWKAIELTVDISLIFKKEKYITFVVRTKYSRNFKISKMSSNINNVTQVKIWTPCFISIKSNFCEDLELCLSVYPWKEPYIYY